jgi:hypothetical protein
MKESLDYFNILYKAFLFCFKLDTFRINDVKKNFRWPQRKFGRRIMRSF